MNGMRGLIVGGGIGGLATAIVLRRIGVQVEVAEIKPEFDVYGVGIILPPNCLRALHDLGVYDEILRVGATWEKWRHFDVHGNLIAEPETPRAGDFTVNGGIMRRDLHDLLYREAVGLGASFRMGTTVKSIENRDRDVRVELTDGTVGTYDLVVGADGVNSLVRKMLFTEEQPKFIGQGVWRYTFDRPPEVETGQMYFGTKTKCGLVPMSKTKMYMFLVTTEPGNPWKPEDRLHDLMREEIMEYGGMIARVRDQLNDPKGVVYRPLGSLLVPDPWYRGRVLLIGDAAHATVPHLAQGGALAIEDAIVLADLIRKHGDVEQVMPEFMKRRFERGRLVVENSYMLASWEMMLERGEWPEGIPRDVNIGKKIVETMNEITEKMTEPI